MGGPSPPTPLGVRVCNDRATPEARRNSATLRGRRRWGFIAGARRRNGAPARQDRCVRASLRGHARAWQSHETRAFVIHRHAHARLGRGVALRPPPEAGLSACERRSARLRSSHRHGSAERRFQSRGAHIGAAPTVIGRGGGRPGRPRRPSSFRPPARRPALPGPEARGRAAAIRRRSEVRFLPGPPLPDPPIGSHSHARTVARGGSRS